MKKTILPAMCLFVTAMFLVPSANALPPSSWTDGKEKEFTGHTFSEEYWTNDSIVHTADDGATVTVVVSYVNYGGAQAFLLAMKQREKDGRISTLPYQLFGMHYRTPGGQEAFVGAVLAFLLAYNDTFPSGQPNGMPDPGKEPIYFVLPFGVGETLGNASYAPIVTAIPAQKLGEGHYKFGMRYQNMYARVIDASSTMSTWMSWFFPLYIAKFSELTITYEVAIDPATGIMTAETFYTIGQVSDLWVWGNRSDRRSIPVSFGISVVHYVALFTSKYNVTSSDTGYAVDTNITKTLDSNLTVNIGDRRERALEVGYRGTFDLINETSGSIVRDDAPAFNILVAARSTDLELVRWQAGFSLDMMTVFAYALSSEIRARYTSPLDLRMRGSEEFSKATFWYAVAFPSWQGYRVVHDPVYTAYTNVGQAGALPGAGAIAIGGILAAAAAIGVAMFMVRRRKQKVPPPP